MGYICFHPSGVLFVLIYWCVLQYIFVIVHVCLIVSVFNLGNDEEESFVTQNNPLIDRGKIAKDKESKTQCLDETYFHSKFIITLEHSNRK